MAEPHRIDVHNHIIPKQYLAGLEKAGIDTSGGIPYPEWSPQIALDVMDRNGIKAGDHLGVVPGRLHGRPRLGLRSGARDQ